MYSSNTTPSDITQLGLNWIIRGTDHFCVSVCFPKELWNQMHVHRPASILVASYVKRPSRFTRVVGLWNHVLIMIQNPLCLTPSAPEEMLQGGFEDIYFYEMLLGGWLRLWQWWEGTAEMTKDPFEKEFNQFVKLPLRAWRQSRIGAGMNSGKGGRFPPIPSLLLLQNKYVCNHHKIGTQTIICGTDFSVCVC
jgi:hypothetical protein